MHERNFWVQIHGKACSGWFLLSSPHKRTSTLRVYFFFFKAKKSFLFDLKSWLMLKWKSDLSEPPLLSISIVWWQSTSEGGYTWSFEQIICKCQNTKPSASFGQNFWDSFIVVFVTFWSTSNIRIWGAILKTSGQSWSLPSHEGCPMQLNSHAFVSP